MSDSPDKSAADAFFGRVQPDDGAMLPCVREAQQRDRLARAAVARCESFAKVELGERLGTKAVELLRGLPSKAVLEKRWPKLRINRLTGRWHDEATDERGDNIESLLTYLGGAARRRR